MKRAVIHIALAMTFLAAGLAVNVGVAWWCAAGNSGIPVAADRSMALRVAEVRRWIDRSPGDRMLQYAPSRVGTAAGVMRTVIEAEAPFLPQRWHHMLVVEAGWPLAALAGEQWSARPEGGAAGGTSTELFVHALDVAAWNGSDERDASILPLRPIWPGLATNSVLFAIVIWAAVVALPRGLRSMIRLQRGRCPACARPLDRGQRFACNSCGWLRGISNWREVARRRKRAEGD